MQAVAMLVPMACLAALSVVTDPYVALGFLTAAVAFASLSHSGYSANIIDIAPQLAGPLMGVVNTIGTVPGVLANILAGHILSSPGGSWAQIFMIALVVYAVGLAAFLRHAQGHELHRPRHHRAEKAEHELTSPAKILR
jgi:nitrate/nitrite transporter NarK